MKRKNSYNKIAKKNTILYIDQPESKKNKTNNIEDVWYRSIDDIYNLSAGNNNFFFFKLKTFRLSCITEPHFKLQQVRS